jgi:hypothetical protein
MPTRPAAPSSFSRSSNLPVRPAPPTGRMRPGAPMMPRGRRFDWMRASLDPYGYGRNPFGPAGFVTQAELGNLGSAGGGNQAGVIYEDVYDDDDADMGCDPTLKVSLPTARKTSLPVVHDATALSTSQGSGGGETGAAIGWESWERPAPPPVGNPFNTNWLARLSTYGGRPAAPPPQYGYRPATPAYGYRPQSYGYRPPPPTGDVSSNLAAAADRMRIMMGLSAGGGSGFYGDIGQDASFGWMMPTLPGAISDSPLRGVFSPDERLGQKMQLGAMG